MNDLIEERQLHDFTSRVLSCRRIMQKFMNDKSMSVLTTHPNHLWVAVVGSEVCGFVMMVDIGGGGFELQKLSVSREHRRLGTGSK